MTRVKICGITRVEDALLCVDAGAHALGFIAVPESPRLRSTGFLFRPTAFRSSKFCMFLAPTWRQSA